MSLVTLFPFKSVYRIKKNKQKKKHVIENKSVQDTKKYKYIY